MRGLYSLEKQEKSTLYKWGWDETCQGQPFFCSLEVKADEKVGSRIRQFPRRGVGQRVENP